MNPCYMKNLKNFSRDSWCHRSRGRLRSALPTPSKSDQPAAARRRDASREQPRIPHAAVQHGLKTPGFLVPIIQVIGTNRPKVREKPGKRGPRKSLGKTGSFRGRAKSPVFPWVFVVNLSHPGVPVTKRPPHARDIFRPSFLFAQKITFSQNPTSLYKGRFVTPLKREAENPDFYCPLCLLVPRPCYTRAVINTKEHQHD